MCVCVCVCFFICLHAFFPYVLSRFSAIKIIFSLFYFTFLRFTFLRFTFFTLLHLPAIAPRLGPACRFLDTCQVITKTCKGRIFGASAPWCTRTPQSWRESENPRPTGAQSRNSGGWTRPVRLYAGWTGAVSVPLLLAYDTTGLVCLDRDPTSRGRPKRTPAQVVHRPY